MKAKHLFTLLIAIIMMIPAHAKKNKAENDGTPIISFTEKQYNFGNIKEKGGPVSHDFEFVNTGNGNLIILDATAQCGCTRPEFPNKPVAPGKKSKVKITYNPLGRPGSFEKVVTIKTNTKEKKTRIKITGTVIPDKK